MGSREDSMIYTWKCTECGEVTEVQRSADDYKVPPDEPKHDWTKIIVTAPTVPWCDLRDSGMFADANGNFAPRKMP